MRILFDSRNTDFKSPFGPVREGDSCSFSIHIPAECRAVKVMLRLSDSDNRPLASHEFFRVSAYGGYEVFSVEFVPGGCGLYFYSFYIETENESFDLFDAGRGMTNIGEGGLWQLSVIPADFHVPDFYAGKIMYQIFPDRFFKSGSPCLDGKLGPYTVHENLSDAPVCNPDDLPEDKNTDFFGGNLRGIEAKLPYLKELGVSVIYLNPIFKARSNHRYDTADYLSVDEMLGTDADFESLCLSAHKLGMRIIIDGVFSHTGSESVYFDINNRFGGGAYGNPSSEYRSWYQFADGEPGYNCWWGVPTLPCTDELDTGFQAFIFGEVLPKWFGLGADGIRLDVADELPDEFIKKLRDRVKELNPEGLVIGEVWEDASNKISYGDRRRYFTGAELDSVMNYPFRNAVIDFVNGCCDASGFVETVMTIAEHYPPEVLLSLMNMLSTHDTPRILTLLGASDCYDAALCRLGEAVAMLFILPGMPCIYYGDEIGMEGGRDPDNRRFFDWNKKTGIPEIYRRMSALRRGNAALEKGTFRAYSPCGGLCVLVRSLDGLVIRAAFAGHSGAAFEPFGTVVYSEGFDGSHLAPHGFVICRSTQ